MKFVILGLSITSSWGNGHATTYRALTSELVRRGHHVLFLERDLPWYAENRDLCGTLYGRIQLYNGLKELEAFARDIAEADCVIVGSFVPDGIDVGQFVNQTAQGVTAFYDIDTPVTLAQVEQGRCPYLNRALIAAYDLYLSFTGGPTIDRLERVYASPTARAFYCSVDPEAYFKEAQNFRWDLGYLGTYSEDRQPSLHNLLVRTAARWPQGKFIVAGPQYPDSLTWPENVERIQHLGQETHRGFYGAQRFTLNITRSDMIRSGYSPSIRLFEAAACESAIISDYWEGLETVFVPGEEILIANDTDDVLRILRDMPESARAQMGARARKRVLAEHTASHRVQSLEHYIVEAAAEALRH